MAINVEETKVKDVYVDEVLVRSVTSFFFHCKWSPF